jgi:hypothetical protein
MASYRRAVDGLPTTTHEGVAVSSVVGSSVHEQESIQKGVRHLSVGGREWLGPVGLDFVNASAIALHIGDRVPGGMLPLSPAFLGGRLQLAAGEFEQHQVRRLSVYYEPVVPATTEGALAIYFRNDIGNTTVDIGSNELGHAATHEAFVQTTVWNSASIDIDPSNALIKYFDYDSSEARMEVQGLVQVMAASDLVFDPTGATGEGTYGHLYLNYDVDFFTPSLDDSVPLRNRAMITITSSATAVAGISEAYPLRSRTLASSGSFAHTIEGLPPGVATAEDLAGYMFYGTAVSDWDVSVGIPAAFKMADDYTGREFVGGIGLWADFSEAVLIAGQPSYTLATWYGDLASLTEQEGSDQADGAIEWTDGLYPAYGDTFKLVGYFVKKTGRYS